MALAVAVLAGGASHGNAQQKQKQIDIGAAEAPLSDSQREDLDQAVRKHDYAAERAVIDGALKEHPNSFEILVMAGRLAYLEKQPADAEDALARADKIKALGDVDRLTLALASSFSRKVPQARAELKKLMTLDPKNAEYPYLLGRIETNAKRIEAAAAAFTKAIQLDSNMVKAYEELGRAQESLDLPDEAKKTYEAGAQHNRANNVQWEWSPLDLGAMLLKADELDGAEKLFQEALRYNRRFAWGHYYLGQVLQKRSKEEEAMTEYKTAVIDDPQLRQAWLALARQFTRQGNKAQADRALGIFKQLETEDQARQGKKN
jgi:superkiller protein 3